MANIAAFSISSQALSVYQTKMNLIAQNIANADTIQTDTEQPYQRREAELVQKQLFSAVFDDVKDNTQVISVAINSIKEDQSPFNQVYDPTNEFANQDGYVTKSNVDVTSEMMDLLSVSRAYEANLMAFNTTKEMIAKTSEIL
ncbi:MAG: flagellar basal body rod protein FlgC [Clostridia bacterium]|jgi:flagellar basal-body rod protein FlgC